MRENRIPTGRRMLQASLLCVIAWASAILRADDRNRPAESAAQQELLLVRAWSPETGELLGWMPLHRVALTLRQLGEGTLHFDQNEAVTVDFPYRPKAAIKHGAVHVATESASFQGRQWIPVESTPNLVYIRRITFYVKEIDFVESNWRSPTPIGETQSK